jgi:hypothetical protein
MPRRDSKQRNRDFFLKRYEDRRAEKRPDANPDTQHRRNAKQFGPAIPTLLLISLYEIIFNDSQFPFLDSKDIPFVWVVDVANLLHGLANESPMLYELIYAELEDAARQHDITVIAVVKQYGDVNARPRIEKLKRAGCIVVYININYPDPVVTRRCKSVDDYIVQIIVAYLSMTISPENVVCITCDKYKGQNGGMSIKVPPGIIVWAEIHRDRKKTQYYRFNASDIKASGDDKKSHPQEFKFILVNPFGPPYTQRPLRQPLSNQHAMYEYMQQLKEKVANDREFMEFLHWVARKNPPNKIMF